jgi:hypothetical protein
MKKAGLLIISLLVLSLVSIALASAEETPGLTEVPGSEQIEQGQQTYEQYTTAENKTQFLKTEWAKLLSKNKYLGPAMPAVDKAFTFMSPFFKAVLGVDYSLSWAFVFSLSLWLIIFFMFYPPASQIARSGILGAFVAAVIATIIGLAGLIKLVVNMLTLILTNAWLTWIALGVAIIFIFLGETIGRGAKGMLAKWRKKREEKKTKETAEQAKEEVEALKKGMKEGSDIKKKLGQ